jgi:CDP-diglyceride synthetase
VADSLKVRTVIGLCLIGAISALMYGDHATGHGYGAIVLCAALTGGGLLEYGRMARNAGPVQDRVLLGFGVLYTLLKGLGYELDERLHLLLPAVAIAFAYTVFFRLLRGSPSMDRYQGMTATAFGFFYIPFLGGFALDVRFLDVAGVGAPGFYYVIAIAKGTDIFAYYFGKLMGRRKIVPSVSPGKTGAGFVGAVIGGAVITCGFQATTAIGDLLPLALAPGVGVLMALIVISGDLIESFLKRSVQVKDSANLLPNFGGVLDIIDSVLIAAPPVFFLFQALERFRP